MKPLHVILIAGLTALCAAAVVTPLAFRAGYHRGLGREKATLVLTLNALEGIRAEEDVTGIVEKACFTTALVFLEDDHYRSDVDLQAAVPRLKKYWDTYWADRPERTPTMARLEKVLSQH